MRRRAFLCLLLLAATARGQPPATKLVDKPVTRRAMPDYDGRGGEPFTVGDAFLLVPKIALFPAYVVTEYGMRQPLRWLGRQAELNNLPFVVADFFKFGDDRQITLYPTLLIDFGFRTSFGVVLKWKNFLGPGNRLNIRAATGGTDYGLIRITDDIRIDDTTHFTVSGELSRRPDFIFHAMGPMSSRADRYRYALVRREAAIGVTSTDFLGGNASFSVAARDISFSNGNCCGEPGIDAGVTAGVFPTPSRYPAGYSAFAQRLHLNWGGRVSRPKDRAGGVLDLTGEHSFDLSGGGWLVYGGALTGYWDISGSSRVLSLRLETELSTPRGGKSVPFNELPALGGNRLPGFLDRRFIGESAFAATLEYKWPVASVIDGVAHFALGNVFWRDLAGLRLGALRKSLGIGIEASGATSSPFGLQLAFGSQPFDLGGDFNEFRFSLRFGGGT